MQCARRPCIGYSGHIDPYNNFVVDLSHAKVSERRLIRLVEEQRKNKIHVVSLKIPAHQGWKMLKAIQLGFRHYQGNSKFSILHKCLKHRSEEKCSYPEFKTVSVGIAAVLFDPEMKKVLVVQEKEGDIKKPKVVTGGVDYGESQETPLEAAVREVFEETGIVVSPEDLRLVGITWSNNFRGINPDIAFVWASRLNQKQVPKAQLKEITGVEWVDVRKYMDTPEDEKGKPWMLRRTVDAALNALTDKTYLERNRTYWSNGKPVDFYC